MTALPPSTDFTDAATTEGEFKTAITALRDFLSGLLGTTGTVTTALQALGALASNTVSATTTYSLSATTDRGKLIDCNGTFTVNLPAAATAGNGFSCAIKNYGTGTITIDPNGSEFIDGAATSLTLAAQESCILVCNGSAWKTVGKSVTPPASLPPYSTYTGTTKNTCVARDVASTTAGSYTKIIEFKAQTGGTLLTRLGLKSTAAQGFVRVYVNDSAVGTARSGIYSSYTYWDENITFSAGDKIQVWAYNAGASTTFADLQLWTALTSNWAFMSANGVDL